MKKLLFIYNAKSGTTTVKKHLADIIDVFIKAGYYVDAYQTQCGGDAEQQIISRGSEFDLIICCGGDGTLNETVNGIMRLENRPAVGYIPAGSTNDFAAGLKLPKRMCDAARTAVNGLISNIDVGRFNDRSFIYIAGFGAFTDVSYQTPQELKNVLGHPAYVVEAIKRLPKLRSYYMTFEFDTPTDDNSAGHVLEGEFLYGMVSNSISVGGFKGITGKNISLSDGLFEVTLVKPPKNVIELQAVIADLLNGSDKCENVLRFKTNKLTVTSTEKTPWVLDGEFGGEVNKAVIVNDKNAIAFKVKKNRVTD